MAFPVDSVIQHTLSKMTDRIEQKMQSGAVVNEQSGLLYLGNMHDSIPRQLFLDSRLSPLDKMAWVMIRLYAQQNEGAVFPTYDELQLQLASPHSGKASRETVSRTLLMLRLTGWLSLCKRVRDKSGKVRGNIYAQHDEPLGLRDAEHFDPSWLDTIEDACQHGNRTIRLTALSVLHDIKSDTSMRHRHSRITIIETRLSAPQNPKEMVLRQRTQPGSEIELSQKLAQIASGSLSSISEPSINKEAILPSSVSELSLKTKGCDQVRKSNCYVRSFTQSVNNTYVIPEKENQAKITQLYWSAELIECLTTTERDMLEPQLQALPKNLSQKVLDDLTHRISAGEVRNVMAYLLSNLKRARSGKFNVITTLQSCDASTTGKSLPIQTQAPIKQVISRATPDHIAKIMAEIRQRLVNDG